MVQGFYFRFFLWNHMGLNFWNLRLGKYEARIEAFINDIFSPLHDFLQNAHIV
jgi:hypothetical protein